MSTTVLDKILEHPDKDEIISKLIIDISEKDIHDWLDTKYCNPGESKFVLSVSSLKDFKKDYLDIYSKIKEDILKVRTQGSSADLLLNNKSYRDKIIKTADMKLDIEEKMIRLIENIEERAAQTFDRMSNQDIDFKKDSIVISYLNSLGDALSKYYEIKEKQEKKEQLNVTNINNTNITVQVLDQQVSIFYDVFKKVLSTLDFETSMKCLDLFNQELSKAKLANTKEFTLEQQIAEVKLLDTTIQKRLNE